MGPEACVAGRPLTSIALWGDLEITHQWPFGSWEAKWSMPLDPWKRPPQLTAGAEVMIRVGAHRIWAGNLAEPNWSEGTFAAVGACRQLEGALCLDNATGQTTSIPNKAIDDAISRGKYVGTRPSSISSVALGSTDETDNLNYVAALLDAYTLGVSSRWYTDAYRAIRVASDPTSPAAMLRNDNGVLGTALEAQVGTVVGRYLDSTTGVLETVSFGDSLPERGVNWTARGPISASAATALCESVWTPLQAQPGWTNGLTVKPGELMSMGGQAIPLWKFRAGPEGMLRLLGVRDLRGLSSNTNIVIGESIWSAGEDESLRLNPIGKVARDIRSIVESGGGSLL